MVNNKLGPNLTHAMFCLLSAEKREQQKTIVKIQVKPKNTGCKSWFTCTASVFISIPYNEYYGILKYQIRLWIVFLSENEFLFFSHVA